MPELLMAMLQKMGKRDKIQLTKLAIRMKMDEVADLELALTLFELEDEPLEDAPKPGDKIN